MATTYTWHCTPRVSGLENHASPITHTKLFITTSQPSPLFSANGFLSIRERHVKCRKYHFLASSTKNSEGKGSDISQAPPVKFSVEKPPAVESSYPSTKYSQNVISSTWKKALKGISSLPLAIGTMLSVAFLSGLGTIIEQGEPLAKYMEYYPEDHPLFGFLTWRLVIGLAFDHMYSSPLFLGLIALLTASLIACTKTRQWPVVRVSQRWSFVKSPEPILKMSISERLDKARISDLATLLSANGFQVFVREQRWLYAFKGLAGRVAPIGVHFALLLIIAGGLYTAIGGYKGSTMLPEGSGVFLGDLFVPNGILSSPSSEFNYRINVNEFRIDYRDSGQVKQFFSDVSLLDLDNKELYKTTISVNTPLRYNGVTVYQTDWGLSSVQLSIDSGDQFRLPLADLAPSGSVQKLFGTFLPIEGKEGTEKRKGISVLASDLQTVVFYDSSGAFVGVRRPGSGKPINVDGLSLTVHELYGSSGLQVKMDPSVPYVYTGFGVLMLTSAISYMSHSQVWAVQDGGSVVVGGKSNRAKLVFEDELNVLLDYVPEVADRE